MCVCVPQYYDSLLTYSTKTKYKLHHITDNIFQYTWVVSLSFPESLPICTIQNDLSLESVFHDFHPFIHATDDPTQVPKIQ